MKVRVRTAIEGPNKRGKYRAMLIVDGKRESVTPWLTESQCEERLRAVRQALLQSAANDGVKVTFNPQDNPV